MYETDSDDVFVGFAMVGIFAIYTLLIILFTATFYRDDYRDAAIAVAKGEIVCTKTPEDEEVPEKHWNWDRWTCVETKTEKL